MPATAGSVGREAYLAAGPLGVCGYVLGGGLVACCVASKPVPILLCSL